MIWYIPLAVTFMVIFLAELGDKTQLITISLSSKHPRIPVFLGVFLGIGVITIIGVVLGTIIFEFIPIFYVKILSGMIFVIFGTWTFLKIKKNKKEDELKEKDPAREKNVISIAFLMTSLAEFGDKTQFAVIALTAQYKAPVFVYIGALLAFALIIGIGVFLGKKISEKVTSKWIDIGSALLFLVIGIIFIIEAFLWESNQLF